MSEIFPDSDVEKAYREFPVDLSVEDWKNLLHSMVTVVDEAANRHKASRQVTAAARKARDVLLATLTDTRLQTLLACLIECQPLFDQLRSQAQKNLMCGNTPEAALMANGMLGRLQSAIDGLRQ